MTKERHPDLDARQARAIAGAVGGARRLQRLPDGTYQSVVRGDDLVRVFDAARATDFDVSIVIKGLEPEALGIGGRTICDLALEHGAPILFRHRDRVLRLAVADEAEEHVPKA